jgi:hypothetical protein
MRQTTLSVPLEVKPESCARLRTLIDGLRAQAQPAGYPDQYQRLLTETPALHFMSISVFPHAEFDPIFVLEANFDGPSGPFWGQLEATFGPELRAMLRCCKRPLDGDGPLYDAVTDADSRVPVAPYLEARTQKPSVFHHGNRGLTRDRILQEAELFLAIRETLGKSPGPATPYASLSAQALHANLRSTLVGRFPWLNQPAPARIPFIERMGDIGRLALFAVVALICLTAPGVALSFAMSTPRYLGFIVALTALLFALVFRIRKPRPGEEAPGHLDLVKLVFGQIPMLLGALAVYAFAASAILIVLVLVISGWGPDQAWRATFRGVLLGLASLPLMVILLALWLRFLERRDSSHDAPQTDEQTLREMIRREDWIAQNHMGSIVLIKPGVLRTILVKAGHLGLGLVLRVKATDGYLGSMRTVHFAQWAFLNNSSRLLFFSNFDHSWDSYLDDFIEKAHGGLTLAWGAGVGFPPARFLVLDGASHGRQFKAWALASRTVSRFWYSAYRDLTVDQIERQARIALALRKTTLKAREAEAWRRDL